MDAAILNPCAIMASPLQGNVSAETYIIYSDWTKQRSVIFREQQIDYENGP